MKRGQEWMALMHAARPAVVLRFLGQIGLAIAALEVVPLAVCALFGDWVMAGRFALVAAFLAALGVAALRLPVPRTLQANEAWSISALAFILAALCGTWPLMAAGLDFTDALFEAVSGVTTTGLSTIAEPANMQAGFLFARAWMQWYGGLGIVVLSVALMLGQGGTVGRRLLEPDTGVESWVTGARFYARRMLYIYLALTVLGIGLLWPATGSLMVAIDHVLAAVSTGGFATAGASLAALSTTAALLLSLVTLAGAVSLPLYILVVRRGGRELIADVELRALLALIALGLAALALLLHHGGMPWGESLWHGTLMSISAQTTTGFSSLNVSALNPAERSVLIVQMLIGGSVGSTAGGIKLVRLLILWQLVLVVLRRASLSEHGVLEPRLGGRTLDQDDIERALLVMVLFGAVIGLSWWAFVAYGYDPLASLFEVVSATGTVGLSTGLSQQSLPDGLKLLLCADMLAGRVEVIALLVLLYPRTWFGRRTEAT